MRILTVTLKKAEMGYMHVRQGKSVVQFRALKKIVGYFIQGHKKKI